MNNHHLAYGLLFKNITYYKFRSIGEMIFVAILSFVLFLGSVLSVSLQNGLDSIRSRFGADIIVVPEGTQQEMESILLSSDLNYFYMDIAVIEQVKSIEGVDRVSPQFYLTSTGASCCETAVQMIGFDPDTDFTLSSWIAESAKSGYEKGTLLVGSAIEFDRATKTLTFFEETFSVSAQLAETGTGLDHAVYMDMETINHLMASAYEHGFRFISGNDADQVVSSLYIKVKDGYRIEEVSDEITKMIDGVSTIHSESIIVQETENLTRISGYLYVYILFFVVMALIFLTILFSVHANARKREFSILRMIGFTRKKLGTFVLLEAMIISAIGAVTGLASSVIIYELFQEAIEKSLGLPYLEPSPQTMFLIIVCSLVIPVFTGPVTAAYSAWKLSHTQSSELCKRGESE